jgi:hypothetical protein
MLAADSPFLRDAPPLYGQFSTPAECHLIHSTPLTRALSEIGLILIMPLRRRSCLPRWKRGGRSSQGILAAAHRLLKVTFEQRLAILRAFSHAGLVLASLVRVHHRLFPPAHPLLDALAKMDPDDI